jgi:hypothetical protein
METTQVESGRAGGEAFRRLRGIRQDWPAPLWHGPEADHWQIAPEAEASNEIGAGHECVGSAYIQDDCAAAEYADPFPARTEPVTHYRAENL